MQLINLDTGTILRDPVSKDYRIKDGEALLDPKTQEYNALRKIVRKKSPDMSHTLPYKFDMLCKKVEAQQAEIDALKQRLDNIG